LHPLALLRAGRERPRSRNAKEGDEVAPLHESSTLRATLSHPGCERSCILPRVRREGLRKKHSQRRISAGHVWSTGDIRATAALVALFTMMSFALIAWLRLRDRSKDRGATMS